MFSLERVKENFDEKYENIKDDIDNWDWDKKKKEIKQYLYKHRFFIIIVPILILITVITFEINLKNKKKLKFKNIKQYGGDNNNEISGIQKEVNRENNKYSQNTYGQNDETPGSKVKGEDKGKEKKGVRRRLGQARRATGLKTKAEKEARQAELNGIDKKLLDKKKEKDDTKSEKKERKGMGLGKALKDGIGKGGSAIKNAAMKFFKYIFYFIAAGFLIFLPGIIYIIIVYLVIRKLVKNINIL